MVFLCLFVLYYSWRKCILSYCHVTEISLEVCYCWTLLLRAQRPYIITIFYLLNNTFECGFFPWKSSSLWSAVCFFVVFVLFFPKLHEMQKRFGVSETGTFRNITSQKWKRRQKHQPERHIYIYIYRWITHYPARLKGIRPIDDNLEGKTALY